MMADYHWITFLATGIVFGIIIIGVAIWYFCWYLVRRGDQEDGPGYTVAISNRLFKGSFMRSNKELPCQNCLFIEMGEMACYQETCPDCGRVPPSRTREIKKYRENLEVLRGEHRRKEDEMNLPPEDDMSTVPLPSSPKKSLGEAFIEKGLLPP